MARVLVCDDAVFMRMTIRETLEKAGHEIVAEADNPEEAARLFERLKPDIVTMDLLMKTPGVEGIKKIIGIDTLAKIIIVSVLGEQEGEVVDAIRAGALGIVSKPVKREMLVAEVARVLKK
jgi:two-component system chemotaxis response regulator CheY